MKITNLISPFASKLLTSEGTLNTTRAFLEARRKRQKRPHQVTFYYRANDPYSFLLMQKMKQFKKDFNIELECRSIQDLPETTNPEPERLERYALKDARLMAELWRLNFPAIKNVPSKVALFTLNQILTAQANSDDFIDAALEAGRCYWRSDFQGLKNARQSFGGLDKMACQGLLATNEKRLTKKGHYMSGTLHYEGEWYWGLDRLHHLVNRLMDLEVHRAPVNIAFYSSMTQLGRLDPATNTHPNLTNQPVQAPQALDFYFSFRSPYSYLAITRTFNLCKLYNLQLNLKPVLPMVMRGLPVPRSKQLYIMRDAAREALLHDIPFGKVVDPVGKGVEQCLAIYEYAAEEGKEKAFSLEAAQGIWSEGIDVSTQKGLRKVVERSGLNWQTAQSFLTKNTWRERAETNRQEMLAQGIWGVPTFRLGELSLWGQDRIDYLERFLENTYSYQTFPSRKYNH